jgi:hypothetical protein
VKSQVDMVTAFSNDDAAARAATAMDDADFSVNPANQHATIPGYPQAHACYEPTDESIGATMARGHFVVSIVYGEINKGQSAVDLSALTRQVQRVLDSQVPLMAALPSIIDAGLTQQSPDFDNMLSRAFVAGQQPAISANYGILGPRAVFLCANSGAVKGELLAEAGVDRCARTPDSELLRARDDAGANALLPKLVDADREGRIDHDIARPEGLSDAECYEQKQSIWAKKPNSRFVCRVAFGRYVARVFSNEEKDVRQRAAAQYAILVNSA